MSLRLERVSDTAYRFVGYNDLSSQELNMMSEDKPKYRAMKRKDLERMPLEMGGVPLFKSGLADLPKDQDMTEYVYLNIPRVMGRNHKQRTPMSDYAIFNFVSTVLSRRPG